MRKDLHQPFSFQLHQGLADRDTTNPKLCSQCILTKLETRFELTIHNPAPHFLCDGRGDGPVL